MFVGFTGGLGSGKTYSMTFYGRYMAETLKLPVYANYETSFATKITSWEQLTSITNGIILLDELHITFDSRLWSNTAKRTHFLLQTRKKNLMCMFTTQHISQVDKRIRNICDYVILCEKKGSLFRNTVVNFLKDEIGRNITLKNSKIVQNWYNTYEIISYIK
jgi:hypothetical protein